MTVAQLIHILKQMPQDNTVTVSLHGRGGRVDDVTTYGKVTLITGQAGERERTNEGESFTTSLARYYFG